MKIFVDVRPTSSIGMQRVAAALKEYRPSGTQLVSAPEQADLQVIHSWNFEAIDQIKTPAYAVVQYCCGDGALRDGPKAWAPIWGGAKLVWSYYDLELVMPTEVPFYRAPLGVDGRVFRHTPQCPREEIVMTSGFVTGPCAEAIKEVAQAAQRTGISVWHLGPLPSGMVASRGWSSIHGISDTTLAELYSKCQWVSGLRHVEGFELPVIEGLVCGARPIVFDRDDMRHWYDEHAVFVPECNGEELVQQLVEVLSRNPAPVTEAERAVVLRRFDWEPIVKGFWERVM